MATIERVIEQLERIDDQKIDQAMAAALPTAREEDVATLAGRLRQRRSQPGSLGLVVHFDRVPGQIQDAMVADVTDLYGALRQAARMRDTEGPRHVIEIVRRARATRLAYLLTDQLLHGSPSINREAVACLGELARWCRSDSPGPHACDGLAAAYLQEVIEHAVSVYDSHRQTGVLKALAALAPRPLPHAIAVLGEPRSAAADVLRLLLHRGDDSDICRAMVPLMNQPALVHDVCSGLKRTMAGPHLGQVLYGAHLLLDDRLRSSLNRSGNGSLLVAALSSAAVKPAHVASARRFMEALKPEPAQEIKWLETQTGADDALARWAVLNRLITLADDPAVSTASNAVISTFCQDGQPQLARVAYRHLERCQWSGLPRLLLALVNSRHGSLRRLAAARLAPMAFDRLWSAWPNLDPRQRRAAGRALIKIDRGFHQTLGRRLASSDRQACVRALGMIHGLNQGHLFEAALVTLVQSDDLAIVASAIRALGTSDSPLAGEVLQRCLDHADSRVRANAVEALQQMRYTGHKSRLVNMAEKEENRPRANAIHAVMQLGVGDALAALSKMLRDRRPQHRTSALWLVETMGLVDVASEVAEMSIADPDHQVQGRAERVVHELIEMMNA